MSKRRGMSKAEKRQRLQAIFFDEKSPFTLKEMEKIGGKQGIVSQSIKEVLQELVDDNLVHLEKIGIANYYWSFPSQATATKQRIVKQLDGSISTKKRKLESAKEEVKMLSVGREKTENYKKLLSEYQNVCSEIQNIDKELLVLRKNDPKVLDEIKANIDVAKAGINRWTDNTFQLQSMLKKKHGMASKDVSKALKINDDYDYV